MAAITIYYTGPLVSRKEALKQSLPRFFPGTPCPHGHISQKRISNWKCIECIRLKYKQPKLTYERLLELLTYNPETGEFHWRIAPNARVKAGSLAGCVDPSRGGYHRIKLGYKSYSTNRLAILYTTGEWPQRFVDHKNHEKSNNSHVNLRQATRSQNGANRPVPHNNKSGFKGVVWDKNCKKWRAQIGANRQHFALGSFDNKIAAAIAYNEAAQKYFGEFAWLNPIPETELAA